MRCTGFAVFVLIACLQSYLVQAADMPNFPDRCNIFGFDLAQKLEAPGRRNLLLSPPSIEIALGMVYAGANGETAEAMSRALGIDGTSRDAAIAELASLQVALQDPGTGVTLKVANAAGIDEKTEEETKKSQSVEENERRKDTFEREHESRWEFGAF